MHLVVSVRLSVCLFVCLSALSRLIFVCVSKSGASVDNLADAVDQLLIFSYSRAAQCTV